MNDRLQQMQRWLNRLGYQNYTLTSASADASFRSYKRLQAGFKSWIVMDAPPGTEPCDGFIDIAARLRAAGLSAPQVIAQNLEQGFLLLTDFGVTPYLSALNDDNVDALYGDALAALLKMQVSVSSSGLPSYNEALLLQEMDLFHDWFVGKLLDIELTELQKAQWHSIQQALVQNALAQPQLFVHRDYHCRNLMVLDQGNPGIIDFQDALTGPITYDLVSLLRDCYIEWPGAYVRRLAVDYYHMLKDKSLINAGPEQFLRWFNLMGLQRHLKAIGIFSRLHIRDGKSGYLRNIPLTLKYLTQVSMLEKSMAGLSNLLEELRLERRIKAIIE